MANTKISSRNEQEIDYYHSVLFILKSTGNIESENQRIVYAHYTLHALNICSTSTHQITNKIVFSFIHSLTHKIAGHISPYIRGLDIMCLHSSNLKQIKPCVYNLKYSIYVNTLHWILFMSLVVQWMKS